MLPMPIATPYHIASTADLYYDASLVPRPPDLFNAREAGDEATMMPHNQTVGSVSTILTIATAI
jgi:hypothetical protein